jgi:hypothetical protein
MKLIDYLHYYLHGKIWEAGVTTCTLIGIGDSYYTIKTKQGTLLTLSNRANIKLVLRRLEDLTDDEWLDIEHETSIMPDAIGWYGVRESFMTKEPRHRWHWTVTNEVLIILRRRGVDVDNLIDNNLAVDQKTITQ